MGRITTRRPSSPGGGVKGLYMEPLNLSITELAARLGVSRKTLSAIVNGRAPVTVDMAMRLSRAFSTSPELWVGLQSKLDLWEASQKEGAWKNVEPVHMPEQVEAPAQA